jgi:hypothetical protein
MRFAYCALRSRPLTEVQETESAAQRATTLWSENDPKRSLCRPLSLAANRDAAIIASG